jgi:dimethylargininase
MHFTRALVRLPTPSMINGITTQNLGTPNFEKALQQHHAYVETLQSIGLTVSELAGDDRYPDACFIEDTCVLFRDLVFITQPGAPSRQGETTAVDLWFAENYPDLTYVKLDGDEYLDGGDVLICPDKTGSTHVLIGVGQRTNIAGANRLRDALLEQAPDLHVESTPFSGMLHLKSGLNDIAPGVLLLAPELQLTSATDLDDFTVHTLPAAESYAANVVVINDHVFIPAGYPTVAQIAAQHYAADHIHALDMSEFARLDGGLTCLSLRY